MRVSIISCLAVVIVSEVMWCKRNKRLQGVLLLQKDVHWSGNRNCFITPLHHYFIIYPEKNHNMECLIPLTGQYGAV